MKIKQTVNNNKAKRNEKPKKQNKTLTDKPRKKH